MDNSIGSQYNSCYLTGDMDNISFNKSGSLNRSIGLKSRSNYPESNFITSTPKYQNVPVKNNEKIDSWFYGILASRQFVANKALFMFTVIMLLLVSILVRFSIWTPIDSIVGEFMMLLNWKFYACIFMIAGLYGFGYGYYAFNHIFSPYNESITSIDKPGFWRTMGSFSAVFLCNMLILPFIVSYSPSWMNNVTTFWLILINIIITSTKIALEGSFRYDFNDKTKYGQGWISLMKTCVNNVVQNASKTFMNVIFSLQYSYLISIVTALLIGSLRQYFFYLFDPMLFIHTFVLVGCFYLLADLICLSSIAVLSESVDFPMPTPFFFSDARETIVNLVNGMNSNDLFMRQFAFYDFKNKTENQCKSLFFTLSQPGNHPRLWNAIVNQCLYVIDYISKSYLKETEISLSKNRIIGQRMPLNLSGDKSIKQTLLLPPTLKPRQSQTQKQMSLINLEPIKVVIKPYVDKIYGMFYSSKHYVSTAETELAINAMYGLTNLIECSNKMDKYGVAHKSLSTIIASLLQLVSSCDQLIRAKFMRIASASDVELRVFETKEVAVGALSDIYKTFEDRLNDLDLSSNQLALFKEYVEKI